MRKIISINAALFFLEFPRNPQYIGEAIKNNIEEFKDIVPDISTFPEDAPNTIPFYQISNKDFSLRISRARIDMSFFNITDIQYIIDMLIKITNEVLKNRKICRIGIFTDNFMEDVESKNYIYNFITKKKNAKLSNASIRLNFKEKFDNIEINRIDNIDMVSNFSINNTLCSGCIHRIDINTIFVDNNLDKSFLNSFITNNVKKTVLG